MYGIGIGVGLAGCGTSQQQEDETVATQGGTRSERKQLVPGDPSVIVWKDVDGTIRARANQDEINAGTKPAAVIQSGLNRAASESGLGSVEVIGDFRLSKKIELPSRTALDLTRSKLAITTNDPVLSIGEATNSTVIGGTLDGSAQKDGEKYLSVIALNDANNVTISNTEVKRGGYYGVNIYECNDCLFWRVRSHDNYRHGFHPGSDTAGRGGRNWLVQCLASNNGVDGISDRGTTVRGERVHNIHANCLCQNNSRHGFLFAGGVATDNATTTYNIIGCRAFKNKYNGFNFRDCRASAVNLTAETNGRSGIEFEGANSISLLNPRIQGHAAPSGIGIKIARRDSFTPDNIVVYGGESRNNEYNIALTNITSTGPITLRDIDARGAEKATIALSEDQTDEAVTIRNVAGYPTTNRGRQVKDGDGRTTTFRWSHGLAARPDTVSVTPRTLPASDSFAVTTNDTSVLVKYRQAPSKGERNLQWWWQARTH
jgi:hypothetical protein